MLHSTYNIPCHSCYPHITAFTLHPVTPLFQEDHVSMGWAAARKLRKAIDCLQRVLAIEIMTGSRAVEMRMPLVPAPATAAAVAMLRTLLPVIPGRPLILI